MTLDGISYDEENPQASVAVIDGDIYMPGGEIGGYVVRSISLIEVTL